MNNGKKTLFISDLHLDATHPEITHCFMDLLDKCDANVDGLYILGDLFEAWIGDDDLSPFHSAIMKALKTATQKGLIIYVMRGNRDFLLGKKFMQATGCTLLPDETKITLYNTPVLLMHGDTLCTRDVAYLKARKRGRNPILQTLFLLLPLNLRRKIADHMRQKSAAYTMQAPREIMDVSQDEVERVMHNHQVQYLIHGHTHQPAFHEFKLNALPAHRMVLGAWHERGNVIIWDDTGNKEWREISYLSV